MGKKAPNIPDAQLAVLDALWQLGKGTIRDVLTRLQWSGREWSYPTVATLLQRLEQKKLVACDRSGFAHVYRATVSRPAVVERRLQQLIDKVYNGDPGLLVVHLLKSHQLSREHQHEVSQILQRLIAGEQDLEEDPESSEKETRP